MWLNIILVTEGLESLRVGCGCLSGVWLCKWGVAIIDKQVLTCDGKYVESECS